MKEHQVALSSPSIPVPSQRAEQLDAARVKRLPLHFGLRPRAAQRVRRQSTLNGLTTLSLP